MKNITDASLIAFPDKSTPGWIDCYSSWNRIGFVNGAEWERANYYDINEQNEYLYDLLSKMAYALNIMVWATTNGESEAQKQGKPRLCQRLDICNDLIEKYNKLNEPENNATTNI